LKSDGTVVATGKNENGQCDISEWKDIVSISVDIQTTYGLKKDGTVIATGDYNSFENARNVCALEKQKGEYAIVSNGKLYDYYLDENDDDDLESTYIVPSANSDDDDSDEDSEELVSPKRGKSKPTDISLYENKMTSAELEMQRKYDDIMKLQKDTDISTTAEIILNVNPNNTSTVYVQNILKSRNIQTQYLATFWVAFLNHPKHFEILLHEYFRFRTS
jgi:hypothetical protein